MLHLRHTSLSSFVHLIGRWENSDPCAKACERLIRAKVLCLSTWNFDDLVAAVAPVAVVCVFVYVFICIFLIFHRCICIILTAPPYVCALNPACGAVPSLVALERQTSKKGRDCGKKVALQKHLVTAGHVRRGSRTFRPQPPQKPCHVM